MRKIAAHKRAIAAVIAAALVLIMLFSAAIPFLYR